MKSRQSLAEAESVLEPTFCDLTVLELITLQVVFFTPPEQKSRQAEESAYGLRRSELFTGGEGGGGAA